MASSARRPFCACLLLPVALLAPGLVRAEDKLDIDPTKIIGNRELPNVLYIVPWKKPLPPEASIRPPVSVLDEVLAPIDRDVFRRQLQYDALVQARVQSAAPPATTPPSPKGQ